MLNRLIETLARGLDSREIPYMIMGGQAVLVFGEPRLTKDVDITLGAGPEHLPLVLDLVTAMKLEILIEDPAAFVQRTYVLPARDSKSGFRVDLVFSDSSYEREAISRARTIRLGETPVRFIAPEDLIIQKIVASRERDLEDVRTVLAKNPGLDHDLIRRWLTWFDQTLDADFSRTFEKISASLKG